MLRVYSFGHSENEWRDRYIKLTKGLIPFDWSQIRLKKSPNKRTEQLLPEEVQFLKKNKNFIILDAGGKHMDSDEFYKWCFSGGDKALVVGPAIGFHREFKEKAQSVVSLSNLTFTHKLIHTMLAESIYRSACMLKNHPFVK